jgi:ribosome-associated protein
MTKAATGKGAWEAEPSEDEPELEADWEDELEEEGLEVIYVGRPDRELSEAEDEEPFVYAERPNKSAGKRALQALQTLADRLLQLGPKEWQSLGLSTKLQQALQEGRRLTNAAAKRRHQRYLAKLLSLEEQSAAIDLIQTLDAKHQADNLRFHRLEQWRDRLLGEGDAALAELLDEYPAADRQTLRQLMRQASKEAAVGKPPAAARKLFKALRTLSEPRDHGQD